jgi:hypothetical protein
MFLLKCVNITLKMKDCLELIYKTIEWDQFGEFCSVQTTYALMSASKAIYEMSAEWRAKRWSLGNIQLKPYQLSFVDELEDPARIFVHEDKELNMLLFAVRMTDNDSQTILIKPGDELKWKTLLREIGFTSDDDVVFTGNIYRPFHSKKEFIDCVFDDEYSLDADIVFSYECSGCSVKKHCSYPISEHDLSCNHVYFTDNPDDRLKSEFRTVKRDEWCEPTVISHKVYDIDGDVRKFIASKMETLNVALLLCASPELIWDLRTEYNVVEVSEVDKCDSDKALLKNKTIYTAYPSNMCDMTVDNIIVLNSLNYQVKNGKPRTVNVFHYLYDLGFSLNSLGNLSQNRHKCINKYDGYRIANLLGLNFFEISLHDKVILSTSIKNRKEGDYLYQSWLKVREESSLTVEQVKSLTYLPVEHRI